MLIADLIGSFDCELLVYTASREDALSITAQERILTDMKPVCAKYLHRKRLKVCWRSSENLSLQFPQKEIKNTTLLGTRRDSKPGNLGTIIRIADWFGIRHIFCSFTTADVYSPKVVQATMGALARVQVHYVNLDTFLSTWNIDNQSEPECHHSLKDNEKSDNQEDYNNFAIYGTFLSGKNIYQEKLSPNGIILMGNEGQGISPAIAKHVTHKLRIPNFPENAPSSESLNVAVATAIVCSEFRRNNF